MASLPKNAAAIRFGGGPMSARDAGCPEEAAVRHSQALRPAKFREDALQVRANVLEGWHFVGEIAPGAPAVEFRRIGEDLRDDEGPRTLDRQATRREQRSDRLARPEGVVGVRPAERRGQRGTP